MKKSKLRTKSLALNASLEGIYSSRPNIYQLLKRQGVSDNVAESAEELLSDWILKLTYGAKQKLVDDMDKKIEELEKQFERKILILQDALNAIEDCEQE